MRDKRRAVRDEGQAEPIFYLLFIIFYLKEERSPGSGYCLENSAATGAVKTGERVTLFPSLVFFL
jgi:hypothetical protein